MNAPAADYIRACMPQRDPDLSRTALLLIDLQYATGTRHRLLSQ